MMDERLQKTASRLWSAQRYYDQMKFEVEDAERRRAEAEAAYEKVHPGWEEPLLAGLALSGTFGGFGAGAYLGRNMKTLHEIPAGLGAIGGAAVGALGMHGVQNALDRRHPERGPLRDTISSERLLRRWAEEYRDEMDQLRREHNEGKELSNEFRRLHKEFNENKRYARGY